MSNQVPGRPAGGVVPVGNGSSAACRFIDEWRRADADADAERSAWVEELTRLGVEIAHPDDGWVDRERSEVSFAYPTMKQRPPGVGVRVALGAPRSWRLVELTAEVRRPLGASRWRFAPVSR